MNLLATLSLRTTLRVLNGHLGAFLNSLWLSTPISEHSRLTTRVQNNEFTSAQHPLNMAGVSKGWQKSVLTFLPAAQLQSPTHWIT